MLTRAQKKKHRAFRELKTPPSLPCAPALPMCPRSGCQRSGRSRLQRHWDTQSARPLPSPFLGLLQRGGGPPWAQGVPLPWRGEPRLCQMRAGGYRDTVCQWQPRGGDGRGGRGEGVGPVSLSPLRDNVSFKSQLACRGWQSPERLSGARAVFGRGRCWLLSKGFLSLEQSLITGVKLVPAKRGGG